LAPEGTVAETGLQPLGYALLNTPPKARTAIIGGGLAGLTAAWQLAQLDPTADVTLYEATGRLGGTIETIHHEGFTIELGPDSWITEKPWAEQLARDLGLASELTPSNDATRVTWILRDGKLQAMPDGMRLMVPTDLSLLTPPLFSDEAIRSYQSEPLRADELLRSAPEHDESIAAFVTRHFGPEVLRTIAAPLLSGVFGGDVHTLSVRAVMPQFVHMERTHGSLITALQQRQPAGGAIFTTLRTGTQTLVDRIAAQIPHHWLRFDTPVTALSQNCSTWNISTGESYDRLILATPAHITAQLVTQLAPWLPTESSSAILAAFTFHEHFPLPGGFGFLVPKAEPNLLLAATFVDQKFPHRTPDNSRLLRAFFTGNHDALSDEELTDKAFAALQQVLGPLPRPAFTILRRWPRSLPQYAVGHHDRVAALLQRLPPGLHVLGNAYRGVGLPDLIRDARALAHHLHGK
jgi:oxygen-dependent protoporphyrinogen oxidase